MTADQIITLVSTQGLAIVLVLGGALWIVRVLIPRYVEGLRAEVLEASQVAKKGLEAQSLLINEQTNALEILSAILVTSMEVNLPTVQFEKKLAMIRALRMKSNGSVQ